jgi:O-acetylserine/cysteine efflux transporter
MFMDLRIFLKYCSKAAFKSEFIMSSYLPLPGLHLFYALITVMAWGGNFVAAKIALGHLSALWLLVARFGLISLVLLPFTLRPRVGARPLLYLSLLYGTGYHALLFMALEQNVPASTSVIIIQLNVPLTACFSWFIQRYRMSKLHILAMGLAFVGFIFLLGSPDLLQRPQALCMLVGAAICWAGFNIYIKQLGSVPIMNFMAWSSLYTLPQLLILAFLFDPSGWSSLLNMPISIWYAVAYTAFVSSILGFGLWFFLLAHHPVSLISPFALLIPVFGVSASLYWLNESLNWQGMIGGLMILVGVATMVLRPQSLSSSAHSS